MAELNWLLSNGCELAKPDPQMLIAIHRMSRGNPCRECNCKDTCPAWKKIASGSQTPVRHGSGNPLCVRCQSPVNLEKAKRRGGKCACGQEIK